MQQPGGSSRVTLKDLYSCRDQGEGKVGDLPTVSRQKEKHK